MRGDVIRRPIQGRQVRTGNGLRQGRKSKRWMECDKGRRTLRRMDGPLLYTSSNERDGDDIVEYSGEGLSDASDPNQGQRRSAP